MNLKTYQAYTMNTALAAVKRDLGHDAVILNTRSFKRGGIFGMWRRTIIEVTAIPAKLAQADKLSAQSPRAKPVAVAAQRAYGVKPALGSHMNDDAERTRKLAMALDEASRRAAQDRVLSPSTMHATVPASVAEVKVAVKGNARGAAVAAPIAKRYVLTNPERAVAASHPQGEVTGVGALRESDPVTARKPLVVTDSMQQELCAIKDMVGQVLHRQVRASGSPSPALPKQLFEMYLKLIGQEISDELADQIVNGVRDELDQDELENEMLVRAAVLKRLAALIPVAQHPLPESGGEGRPLTIALIGPTGVGKTTTLAKLAASFKLRHSMKVGLITSDTYRIAAVDQLRTYANIIGLPLEVALTPAEMSAAVDKLSENDVILIDTAGRSQNDSGRLSELKQFISAARPHEVHLVLSSTAGERVLLREAEAFSEIGVHKIVLTKLDEAVTFGMLVNVVRQVGKELSFVTTGQEVPTHLEVGRAERLAELILGGAVHG